MASAEREPITGVWGRSPQRGSRRQSPRWGSGGLPPEAERVLRFGHAMETANLPYNSLYFNERCKRFAFTITSESLTDQVFTKYPTEGLDFACLLLQQRQQLVCECQ